MARDPSISLQDVQFSGFGAQLRKDRWPDPRGEHRASTAPFITRNAELLDAFGSENEETYAGPPHISAWRMNLVALSQQHNLYFVASRDSLHVYRPRSLSQTLPTRPDLIIELPQSVAGFNVGGYINYSSPHSVNHLKVGNLGTTEIVLMCCDDGDVLAFYTHQIQQELERPNLVSRVRPIDPFLHANVGKSAWGLAIHQQSRLIAVSSNLKEVTVFVPALHNESLLGLHYESLPSSPGDDEPGHSSGSTGHAEAQDESLHAQLLGRRMYDLRFTFELGDEASNIPAVDFVSDEDGEANYLIAVDISGAAWKLDPRKPSDAKDRLIGTHADNMDVIPQYGHDRSWAVLSLDLDDFRTVSTLQEAWNRNDSSISKTMKVSESTTGGIEHAINVTPPVVEPTIDKLRTGLQGVLDMLQNEADMDSETSESTSDEEDLSINEGLDSSDEEVPEVKSSEEDQSSDESSAEHEDFEDASTISSSQEIGASAEVPASELMLHEMSSLTDDPNSEVTTEAWEHRSRPRLWNDSVFKAEKGHKNTTNVSLKKSTHSSKHSAGLSPSRKSHADQDRKLTAILAQRNAEVELIFLLTRLPQELLKLVHRWSDLQNLGDSFTRLERLGFTPLVPSLPTETDQTNKDSMPLVLLRTFAQDIELVELNNSSQRHLLPTRVTPRIPLISPREIARFNMLCRIPELHLVLIASQSGSVVVLGLTKVYSSTYNSDPFLTCRVEKQLPLPQHWKFVPRCPLLGIAASPLQGSREGGFGVRMWRRWRVLLHYYDHTVLTYEIFRGERGVLSFEA